MKQFVNLNPKHIEDLNYWFWIRENISFINGTFVEIVSDYWVQPPSLFTVTGLKDWLWLFTIPVGYIIGFVVGSIIRKRDALICANEKYDTPIYNKKNIEYITVLHTLSGGCDEPK